MNIFNFKLVQKGELDSLVFFQNIYQKAAETTGWFHEFPFMQNALFSILNGGDSWTIRENFDRDLKHYMREKNSEN